MAEPLRHSPLFTIDIVAQGNCHPGIGFLTVGSNSLGALQALKMIVKEKACTRNFSKQCICHWSAIAPSTALPSVQLVTDRMPPMVSLPSSKHRQQRPCPIALAMPF